MLLYFVAWFGQCNCFTNTFLALKQNPVQSAGERLLSTPASQEITSGSEAERASNMFRLTRLLLKHSGSYGKKEGGDTVSNE